MIIFENRKTRHIAEQFIALYRFFYILENIDYSILLLLPSLRGKEVNRLGLILISN